jgi:hypothetical protein
MITGSHTTIVYGIPDMTPYTDMTPEEIIECREEVGRMVLRILLLLEASLLEPRLAVLFDRILGTTAEMMKEELKELENQLDQESDLDTNNGEY